MRKTKRLLAVWMCVVMMLGAVPGAMAVEMQDESVVVTDALQLSEAVPVETVEPSEGALTLENAEAPTLAEVLPEGTVVVDPVPEDTTVSAEPTEPVEPTEATTPVEPISIHISISPMAAAPGDTVTLSASVSGGGDHLSYQWQWANMSEATAEKAAQSGAGSDASSTVVGEADASNGMSWHDEPGATGLSYSFTATEENLNRYWRLKIQSVVTEEEPEHTGFSLQWAVAIADEIQVNYSGAVKSVKEVDDNETTQSNTKTTAVASISKSTGDAVAVGESVVFSVALDHGDVSAHEWQWVITDGEGAVTVVSSLQGNSIELKGNAPGTVQVQVRAVGEELTASQSVTVAQAKDNAQNQQEGENGAVGGEVQDDLGEQAQQSTLQISASQTQLEIDETATLTVTGVPEGAELQWSCMSDEGSVEYTTNGAVCVVTAKAPGAATFTAKVGEDKASVDIEINEPFVNLMMAFAAPAALDLDPSFSPASLAMKLGETATTTLANAPDGSSVSVGSGAEYIEISTSGETVTVKGKAVGSATVNLLDEDGTTLASCTVAVSDVAAGEVTISPNDSQAAVVGETIVYTANVSDAVADRISWSAAGPSGAFTVSENGTRFSVTGNRWFKGSVLLYFDGELVAEKNITYYDIQIRSGENEIDWGKTVTYTASVSPTLGNTALLNWEVSPSGIVEVKPDGYSCKLTGINEGSGTLTLSFGSDGNKKVVDEVPIRVKPIEIDLSDASSLNIGDMATLSISSDLPADVSVDWKTESTAITLSSSTNGACVVTARDYSQSPATVTMVLSSAGTEVLRKSVEIKINIPQITIDKSPLAVGETANVSISNIGDKASVVWNFDANGSGVLGKVSETSVEALKGGTGIIEAQIMIGSEPACKAEAYLVVANPELNVSSKAIIAGEEFTLSVLNVREDAQDLITWTTDNPQSVLLSGTTGHSIKVEGLLPSSSANVIAQIGETKLTCKVDITNSTVSSIRIDAPRTTLYHRAGYSADEVQLSAIAQPNNVAINVNWSVPNSNVVTINPTTGLVTTTGAGSVSVKAVTKDGKRTAYTSISVRALVESVKITNKPDGGMLNLATSKTYSLRTTILPNNAADRSIAWVVEGDARAVTVSSSGYITANSVVEPTTVTVWALPNDSATLSEAERQQLGDSIRVTVWPSATRLTIYKGSDASREMVSTLSFSLAGAAPVELHALVSPVKLNDDKSVNESQSTNQNVTWKTSNASVASIQVNGNRCTVTPVAQRAGTAVITATSEDGTVRATVNVTVANLIERILISGPGEVAIGSTITLSAAITPEKPTNTRLQWTSKNPEIATVTGTGAVRGVSEGTAMIVVESVDGNAKTEYTVRVIPAVTGITIVDKKDYILTSLAMDVAKGPELVKAVTQPSGALTDVTWTNTNSTVASIVKDADGYYSIRPLKNGTTIITAIAQDGSNRRATLYVTVATLVDGITIDGAHEVAIGKTTKLTATVTPTTATSRGVIWSSSNERIAQVNSIGIVTGVLTGEVSIYATSADGARDENGEPLKVEHKIKVTPVPTRVVVMLDGAVASTAFLKVDDLDGLDLEAMVYPVEPRDSDGNPAVGQDVRWTSSNTSVARVDQYGHVEVVRAGQSVITATTIDGSNVSGTCTLTVGTEIEKLVITGPTTVVGGNSIQLTSTITPNNYNVINKTVLWTVEGSDHASISSTGWLTTTRIDAKTTVIVTATAKDDSGASISAEHTVTILPGTTNIVFAKLSGNQLTNIKSLTIDSNSTAGKEADVYAIVSPSSASADMKWTTSNEKVAQVVKISTMTVDGGSYSVATIRGVSIGTATITATTQDGSRVSGSFSVRVNTVASSMSITEKNVSLLVGRNYQLSATVAPYDAVNKEVYWTIPSTETDVAEVNRLTGVVTAKSPGTVTVTATLKDDPTMTDTCTVTVYAQPTAIKIMSDGSTVNQITVAKGSGVALMPSFEPEGARIGSGAYTVRTANSLVASVQKAGEEFVIAGVTPGKTTIVTVTSVDRPTLVTKLTVIVVE